MKRQIRIIILVMVVCVIAAYLMVRCCVSPPELQTSVITTDPPIIVPTMPSCCTTIAQTTEATTTVMTEAETTVTEIETESTTMEMDKLYHDIPLSADIQLYTFAVCESYGINPTVIFAMMKVESQYILDAVGDDGEAIGILQVHPRWHQERADELNVSIYDPKGNILVAIDLLSELLDKYGDYGLAVTAYNRGTASEISAYGEKVLNIAYEIENQN